MENALWNLILKICSISGGLLLFLGVILLFAAELGYTDERAAGLTSIAAAALLTGFSVVGMNMTLSRASNELATSREIAHQLAGGELYLEQADSEMAESLRRASLYITEKVEIIERISAGDLRIINPTRSDNDILGNAIKRLIDDQQSSHRNAEDIAAVQRHLARLASEIEAIAQGDLTVQADPLPQLTGQLGEAVNTMIRSLRLRIKQIKDMSARIESTSVLLSTANTELEKSNSEQLVHSQRIAGSIKSLAHQVNEVAQNSFLAERLSGEAMLAAQGVFTGSQNSLNVVNAVRRQMQETAKRIKRLGERSQEISSIVSSFEEVSDRTSVLGLNSALLGTAERSASNTPFSAEIEQLADRASKLSRQLSALTQHMITETKELSASMDETIREVITGTRLNDKIGGSAKATEQSVVELSTVLRSITESTGYQAKVTEEMTAVMSKVAEMADANLVTTKKATESSRSICHQTSELRNAISPFRLPAESLPLGMSDNSDAKFAS